ncbi:MAG TPA: tetratricopeptide repeat protein [Gemmataceae bacterium]|nr:tetratricopeptide repeat protein [Gemmataceae bacterium]
MRVAIFALFVSVSLISQASAQFDKKALAKEADLPRMGSTAAICGIDPSRTIVVYMVHDTVDLDPIINGILAEMIGDARDAERYYRLGMLYRDDKQSAAAFEKAKSYFEQRLGAMPQDGYLLARLGLTQWRMKDSTKGEELIQAAVRKAPKDWRCWCALGQLLESKAARMVPYDKDFSVFARVGSDEIVKSKLLKQAPLKSKVDEARSLRAEALTSFNKAVELAPQESQVYLERAASKTYGKMFEYAVKSTRKPVPSAEYDKMMTTPDIIADVQKAAELDPRNSQVVTTAAVHRLVALLAREKDAEPGVTEQVAQTVFDLAEKRLRVVMKEKDPRRAAEATVLLGYLYLMHPDERQKAKAIALIRRGGKLDPDNALAWELAIATADSEADLLDLCEKRAKRQDSARIRFMLANAYDATDKTEQAEGALRACLKKYPDDKHSRIGLAALLIRRNTPATLKEAEQELDRVHKLLGNAQGELQRDYDTTRAILTALQGDEKAARARLRAVLKAEPDHESAKAALDVLDPAP